jgi:hypothetical protein
VKFRLTESISNEFDNLGNELTDEQAQFFRNSKVRDHRGNLLVCYHGTDNSFDTFEKGDIGFHFGTESAANQRREYRGNPDEWYVDKYYLNIENYIDTYDFGDWDGYTVAHHILESHLLDLTDDEIKWLQVVGSSGGYYDGETTRQVRDFLISKGIDGFMYENAYEDEGSISYIVFNANQVKRVSNQKPTSSSNLNEGVAEETDNQGNELTPEQISFFRNSKVRDSNGNLLVVYHGTPHKFDTFDKTKVGSRFTYLKGGEYRPQYTLGFYFTDDKHYASTVGNDGLQNTIKECYLNIENPLVLNVSGWGGSVAYADICHNDIKRWSAGHDGIIINHYDEDDKEYLEDRVIIAFEPNQIKSVTTKSPTESDNLNESIGSTCISINVQEAEDIATQFVSAMPTYQSWIDTQGRFLDATDLGSHYSMIDEVFWQLTDKGRYNNVKPVELDPEDYNRMTDAIFESFLELGWIQIGLDCNFASMHKKPTSQQYDAVEKYLDYAFNNKNYKMAICIDNNGFHSVEYNLKEVTPEYVIGRIKRCFSSGSLYESKVGVLI